MGGFYILDVALLVNHGLDSNIRDKILRVVYKVDIEKAYEHMSRMFLLLVVKKMGFGSKWLGWINFCTSTRRFFVLINGFPCDFFDTSRGEAR